jgi:hypothetical protein
MNKLTTQEQVEVLKHLVNELFNLVDDISRMGDDRTEVLKNVYSDAVIKSNNFKY